MLLLQDAGTFTRQQILRADDWGTAALLGTLTDYDADAVLDVLIPQDSGRPAVLFRGLGPDGQGLPDYEDVSTATGVQVPMSAMGFDSGDLNRDGRLDYCISDIGPPVCLVSDGMGKGFVQESLGLGLTQQVVGWGLALDDLNNDGRLDLVQASGPSDTADGSWDTAPQRNLLWIRQADGTLLDLGETVGFADEGNFLGLVTADLDGDGALEIVVAGPGRAPLLFHNTGAPGSFIEIDVVGRDGSPAFGAQVRVRVGDEHWTREVTSGRGPNQGSTRLHFGLGSVEEIDEIKVLWPGGAARALLDVPARQVLRVAPE